VGRAGIESKKEEGVFLRPEEKLEEMGLEIPSVPPPIASYQPGVKSGSYLFISGQIPLTDDEVNSQDNTEQSAGPEQFPWVRRPVRVLCSGQVGRDVTVEEAHDAARTCALKCISIMQDELGDLSRVKRIAKVTGYVNAAPGFAEHPKVVNGASDLLVEVFGEAGKHARAAVGMSGLPLDAAVEVEMVVEFE